MLCEVRNALQGERDANKRERDALISSGERTGGMSADAHKRYDELSVRAGELARDVPATEWRVAVLTMSLSNEVPGGMTRDKASGMVTGAGVQRSDAQARVALERARDRVALHTMRATLATKSGDHAGAAKARKLADSARRDVRTLAGRGSTVKANGVLGNGRTGQLRARLESLASVPRSERDRKTRAELAHVREELGIATARDARNNDSAARSARGDVQGDGGEHHGTGGRGGAPTLVKTTAPNGDVTIAESGAHLDQRNAARIGALFSNGRTDEMAGAAGVPDIRKDAFSLVESAPRAKQVGPSGNHAADVPHTHDSRCHLNGTRACSKDKANGRDHLEPYKAGPNAGKPHAVDVRTFAPLFVSA